MTIHMRDLKGFFDLANDYRRAEYERKRRIAAGITRSVDHGADVLDDCVAGAMFCVASLSAWIGVVGAFMVYSQAKNGWLVSVTGLVVFVLALVRLGKVGRHE